MSVTWRPGGASCTFLAEADHQLPVINRCFIYCQWRKKCSHYRGSHSSKAFLRLVVFLSPHHPHHHTHLLVPQQLVISYPCKVVPHCLVDQTYIASKIQEIKSDGIWQKKIAKDHWSSWDPESVQLQECTPLSAHTQASHCDEQGTVAVRYGLQHKAFAALSRYNLLKLDDNCFGFPHSWAGPCEN